jgi:dUTP pyrophosphatase
MNKSQTLGYYKLDPEAFEPAYATQHSACFDVRVCFPAGKRTVDVWSADSKQSKQMAFPPENPSENGGLASMILYPGDRALLPTQLVLDIPEGYSVRLHMRSGLAVKGGLMLSNCEGVIDSDYVQQLMIPVTNTTKVNIRISHGDRICQGELVERIPCSFEQRTEPIALKTDRDGGFGSTGKA